MIRLRLGQVLVTRDLLLRAGRPIGCASETTSSDLLPSILFQNNPQRNAVLRLGAS